MDLFGTKIKLVLLLISCCCLLMAACWLYVKQKKPQLQAEKAVFNSPKDKITKRVLANGMHVLLYKNESLPKVLVQIAYDVGSFVEESGERGLAHLVEHMIFKGTDKLSETDLDAIARKYGASYNASTSFDVTTYYFESNKNNWRPFLEILADCMQNVRFEPEHLASEVKAVVQELNMGKDNYWRTLFLKGLELSFPANHPYHVAPIGFKEDLLDLTADRIKTFYKKHYNPEHATLFVVGDINPEEAMLEIEKDFGSIVSSQTTVEKEFPGRSAEIAVHHTRFYEDVKSDHVLLYWQIPGYKGDQEQIISVTEAILSAGEAGLLHRALVDDHKVAASASAYALKLMEAGLFCVMIEPLPGKKEQCIQLVKEVIQQVVEKGISAADIERVAKIKMVSFFNKMVDYQDLVSDWIYSYFATHDEQHLFDSVNRFNTITSADVQGFVKEYMDPLFMNQLEVLPLPADKKEYKERLKQASDELDKKILEKHHRTAPIEPVRAALDHTMPAPLEFSLPKPERVVELPNGLSVILSPQHHTPMVSLACNFKDASYFNEAREGQLLDLMMGLLMEGSKGYSKKDNVDFFEQRGAGYGFASGGAAMSCLASDFAELVERLVYILRNPTLPQDALEKIKKISLDNYARAKDSPKDVAFKLLKNALYQGHPYSWTFDDAIADVSAATTQSLRALHDQLVTGDNMVLSVVGDFDAAEMEAVLRKHFGELESKGRNAVTRVRPALQGAQAINYELVRDQVFLVYGKQASVTVYDEDYLPLKLLTSICFKSLGSRLFKVRETTGLFYTAFGEFAAKTNKMPGFDYVGMIVNPENLEKAEAAVYNCLTEIAQRGITVDELNGARSLYERELVDLLGNNGQICRLFTSLYSLDLPYDYYEKALKRVHEITVEEMNAIAARYVSQDGFVRVRVGRV